MDKLIIQGGRKLVGELSISGAKNAALPILFSTILNEHPCTLENVPDLADIKTTLDLLTVLGSEMVFDPKKNQASLCTPQLLSAQAPYDLVRTMRASILVLGPMLSRFGQSIVSLPGGCSIGARPVDLHLKALEQMGAEIQIHSGYIHAKTKGSKLRGANIIFEKVSVGATENLMMAAVLASGKTVLQNCALEPEILDLANFLNKCGAKISGQGSPVITIEGVEALHGCTYSIIPDRIEAGTYLIAAAITGGDILLKNVPPPLLTSLLEKLKECGLTIVTTNGSVRLFCEKQLQSKDIVTQPFPGFATDMQAQFMSLMCVSSGTSVISETIFENRFMHVPELIRLGADIKIQGNTAIVKGLASKKLTGAFVMATDLRASASLVLAGLAAEGETHVRRIYHLDRGYEKMEQKLQALGASITRAREND